MKENRYYLKSVVLIFGLNALIYFLIKLFISNYHIIGLPIDDKIPFLIGFIWIYMIWYPFEILSLFFIYKFDKNRYLKVITAICLSLLVLYACFIVYPTMVIRPAVTSFDSVTSFIAYVAFKADTPVNCFPSGHCILCFLMMFGVIDDKKIPGYLRWILVIVNVLIILSTLFTKQHVLLDVLGSLVVTSIMYYGITKTPYIKKVINKMKNQLETN